jgi:hypothetical protein
MRSIFTLLFCSTTLLAISQQRIGIDVSTRITNLNVTASFNKVIKGNFIYSVGVYAGGVGTSDIYNDTMRLYSGKQIRSPYPVANQPISDSLTSYELLDYEARGRALGLQFGLGHFFEFGVMHGLRINLLGKVGLSSTKVRAYYRSTSTFSEKAQTLRTNYFYGSISPEIFHTIRKTGRNTLYWGVKLHYHFTIDKARFNPTINQDLLYGFEPELTMGFTRVIGNCK